MPGSVSNARKRKRRRSLAGDPPFASGRRLTLPTIILAAIVIADQLTKNWVLKNLRPGEPLSIIGDFFQLKLTYNIGGAMGTELGSGTFYLVTSSIILAVVIYLIITSRDSLWSPVALTLIAAGAVGNIIDRIRLGMVVDFIDVDIPDVNLFGFHLERWWTFNIADSSISIGMVLLLLYILFHPRKKEIPAVSPDSQALSN